MKTYFDEKNVCSSVFKMESKRICVRIYKYLYLTAAKFCVLKAEMNNSRKW